MVDIDELLRLSQAGDADALNQLCDHCFEWLCRWGHGRLPLWARGRFSTADLAQMTLMSMLRTIESFEPNREGALRAFLATVFRNALRDEIRAVQRQARVREKLPAEEAAVPGHQYQDLVGRRAAARVEKALNQLSPSDRAVVDDRMNDFSFAVIAQRRGMPSADAARMAFNRALKRLKVEVESPTVTRRRRPGRRRPAP